MDPNPLNGNNTYRGYVPPPYVSPLHEAILPFYNPVNTYPQAPPEMHQENYISINTNWNNPAYVPQTTVQATVTSHAGSANYLLNNFILDTSDNMNPNNFMTTAKQVSEPEKQDPNMQVFQCEKCPSKFYSRQAFGGHMSSHSKLARKYGNMSQEMMATADISKQTAASIFGMYEGSNASASATSKKRGRKKGKNVVADEPKAKKQV